MQKKIEKNEEKEKSNTPSIAPIKKAAASTCCSGLEHAKKRLARLVLVTPLLLPLLRLRLRALQLC